MYIINSSCSGALLVEGPFVRDTAPGLPPRHFERPERTLRSARGGE